MRSLRVTEKIMLGYSIERVENYDEIGLLQETQYEILSSATGEVVGFKDTLRGAQNLVIERELDIALKQQAA
jgi:hypothetical protein